MYDEVICEVPLPDGYKYPVFQTKDFDCPYLEKYIIRADGRLVHKRPWWIVPEENTYYEDMNFHGVLNFYHYNCDTDDWREYNAKFTDGQLVAIEIAHERAAEV